MNSTSDEPQLQLDASSGAAIALEEFCDMNLLYSLIDNWSKSTGMSAVIVNAQGEPISGSYGLTDFCTIVHAQDQSPDVCQGSQRIECEGLYTCPMGFYDFSVPIALPNGALLGRVLAGQILRVDQDEGPILKRALDLGIDAQVAEDALSRVHRKTQREMDGAYTLLKEILDFFVGKSYAAWKTAQELKAAPAKQDRTLSQITQIMYSYNLTVDLETGLYSLITGTGMERTVEEYGRHAHQSELVRFQANLIHPAYTKRFEELVDFSPARIREEEDGFRGSLEYPVLYPGDDQYEWHEVNVFIGTEEDGRRVANVLGRDITEAHNAQERKEHELRAADAKNQILSELTKMLYSYNLTLNLRSGKYSLIMGTGMTQFMEIFKSTDDYETAYAQKLTHLAPEFVESFAALASLESLRARKNANGFIGNLEYGAVTDYGKEWHEINVFVSTDEAGEPVANILGRDITDAHKRQEQRENQQRAAIARDQLLSGITKMLYSYNLTVDLNTWKYSLITGTGMPNVLQAMQSTDDYVLLCSRLLRNVSPEDRNSLEKLIGVHALQNLPSITGFVGTRSCRIETEGGSEWHEVNLFMSTNENGTPVANILGRDITDAHNKADTKAQLKIANASSAAKTAFLFNMSHDIRTPMNAIIGFTELLEKHLDDPDFARDCIGKIQAANEFLLSLINNVLEMARIESGKETLDETLRDAYSFNDSLYALFDSQMREKGIHFTRSIKVEHAQVICDETKLREIFLNILSNALKYTPSGGKVTMEVSELPCDRPGYVLYKTVIADTGVGMSEDFLPHIFEEFSRERSSTESRISGTGLGMPIVKKLVDLMQGTVEVESQVGVGSTFTVVLPHRIPQKDDIAVSPSRPDESALPALSCGFAGRRILLAEDNELNAEIATAILVEAGFEVERAEDGVVCVDLVRKAPPGYYDLVLMDIQMPNMDGYKATQTIRKFDDPEKAGIVIVAMTANAFEEDRRNAVKAGMNAHISKPFRVNELLSALAAYLQD